MNFFHKNAHTHQIMKRPIHIKVKPDEHSNTRAIHWPEPMIAAKLNHCLGRWFVWSMCCAECSLSTLRLSPWWSSGYTHQSLSCFLETCWSIVKHWYCSIKQLLAASSPLPQAPSSNLSATTMQRARTLHPFIQSLFARTSPVITVRRSICHDPRKAHRTTSRLIRDSHSSFGVNNNSSGTGEHRARGPKTSLEIWQCNLHVKKARLTL